MAQSKEDRVTRVEQANHASERGYWWMRGVDRETAERLDVLGQVSEVLKLLQKVDNITMDITIKIKQK